MSIINPNSNTPIDSSQSSGLPNEPSASKGNSGKVRSATESSLENLKKSSLEPAKPLIGAQEEEKWDPSPLANLKPNGSSGKPPRKETHLESFTEEDLGPSSAQGSDTTVSSESSSMEETYFDGGEVLQESDRDSKVQKETYSAIREGISANPLKKVGYLVRQGVKVGAKMIANKIKMLGKRTIFKKEGVGFEDNAFQKWNPDKKALGLEGDEKPTPFQLARALGFQMSEEEVTKELVRMPKIVSGWLVLKGEEEGDPENFRAQMGIGDDSQGEVLDGPFGEALSLDAGVSGGYSVGTHSMMVLRMFDQHLTTRFEKNNKFDGVVTQGEFRLFLMLHDIGKGLAVQQEGKFETRERKRKELEYCGQAIQQMVAKGVFSEEVGKLFMALLDDVTIGKLLTGKITEDEAADELKQAMTKFNLNLEPAKFFSLAKLFHIADAGAYKNIRRFDGLFEVSEEGKMRHARDTGRAGRQAGPKLKRLKGKIT